jgi:hypothetical protein
MESLRAHKTDNSEIVVLRNATTYYCPKDGNTASEPGQCPACNQEMREFEPSLVKMTCNYCGAVHRVEYGLLSRELICWNCSSGILEQPLNYEGAPNFKVDSKWNGKDRGKVIQEKNEQLKRRHAGMEGESRNLREEITKKTQAMLKRESLD